MMTNTAAYVLIPRAAELTGLTAKAIERKIETGVWIEGAQFRRAPDGRIYISIKGFEAWVESGGSIRAPRRSRSLSPSTASSAERLST